MDTTAADDTNDPLAKVKSMVTDLIARLHREEAEEATHDSWCKTEVAKTEQWRDKADGFVKKARGKLVMIGGEIERLKAKIPEMKEELGEVKKDTQKQGDMFAEEHRQRQTEIAEAEVAANSLTAAMGVLQE